MKYGPHELRKLIVDLKDDHKEVSKRGSQESNEMVRGELENYIKELEEEGFGQ